MKWKKEKNVILYIDEIHNLMGAEANSDCMDASNLLKPYLAEQNIKFMGFYNMMNKIL